MTSDELADKISAVAVTHVIRLEMAELHDNAVAARDWAEALDHTMSALAIAHDIRDGDIRDRD